MGAKAIDARGGLGALIIKHLEKIDDRGTIEIIQKIIILQAIKFEDNHNPKIEKPKTENDDILTKSTDNEDIERNPDAQKPTNSGKLQMDATVCDAHIKYPTD